jgi:glycine/D-amino acid oxidase-like deaminating enzyme
MPIVDGEVVVDPETGTRGFVYAVPMFPGGKQAFKCAVHMIGELMHTEDFHVRPGSSPAGFDLAVYHRRSLLCSQPESDELDTYQQKIVQAFVKSHLPSLDAESVGVGVVCRCLYTSAPDGHFVIGYHPEAPDNVIVVAGFHGEGFKFAPVIGECVSELVATRAECEDSLATLTKELLQQCTPSRFEQ